MPTTFRRASLPDTPMAGCGANACVLKAVTIGANAPYGTGSMTAVRWAKASAGGVLRRVPHVLSESIPDDAGSPCCRACILQGRPLGKVSQEGPTRLACFCIC